jgi:glycosyltransferase involved in cell wall biosynthesis
MITVIICTYNPKLEYLSRAIHSVLNQNCSNEFEFFVVDNNSKFSVSELAIVKERSIRVVLEKKPGLTAARECAVENAKGNILVFVDDDNILSSDYLQTVETLFENANIGVMSGTIFPAYEKVPEKWFAPLSKMLALRSFPEKRLYLTNIPEYTEYFPIGAGMCIRKEILVAYFQSLTVETRIEGRKENSLSSGEDLDIDFFAIAQGFLIGVHSGLIVQHIIPPVRCTLEYLCRLSASQAQSNFLINNKWKNIFHTNVLPHFSLSKQQILFRLCGLLVLYPLKRYRVSFSYYKMIYSLIE